MPTFMLGETQPFWQAVSNFAGGQAQNVTGSLAYQVFAAGSSGTPLLSGNMTQVTGVTGLYEGSIAITSGNGFAVNQSYVISTAALVGGIAAGGIALQFVVRDPNMVPENLLAYAIPPDFGDTLPSNIGMMFSFLYRRFANQLIANGATLVVYRDDGVTAMTIQDTNYGPNSVGPIQAGPPGGS
jgi:hypothetical protein